jgi:hypothetical protein
MIFSVGKWQIACIKAWYSKLLDCNYIKLNILYPKQNWLFQVLPSHHFFREIFNVYRITFNIFFNKIDLHAKQCLETWFRECSRKTSNQGHWTSIESLSSNSPSLFHPSRSQADWCKLCIDPWSLNFRHFHGKIHGIKNCSVEVIFNSMTSLLNSVKIYRLVHTARWCHKSQFLFSEESRPNIRKNVKCWDGCSYELQRSLKRRSTST